MKRSLGSTRVATLALALALGACSDDSDGGGGPLENEPPTPANLVQFFATVPGWEAYSPILPETNTATGPAVPDSANVVIDSVPNECTTTPYSLTTTPEQITTLNPDVEVLWVGALLQGDGYVKGIGSLAELPIRQRAPVELTLDLLSGANSRTVENPTVATVNQAIGQLISDAQAAGHRSGSSIFYTSETAHSLEQASLKMGISAKYMNASLKTSLSADMSEEKRTVTAYFVQRMFTASMVLPEHGEDVFSEGFTQEMLEREVADGRMGPNNAPVYVSSIVYGRILMFSFTSTSSETKIQATLNAMYNDGEFGGELEAGLQEVLDNAQIRVVTVGGDADHALGLIKENNLAAFFTSDAPLTTARPIAYTIRSLKDNVIARVSETTTYNLEQCSPVQAVATGATYRIWVSHVVAEALPTIDWPPPLDFPADNRDGAEIYYTFFVEDAGGRHQAVLWDLTLLGGVAGKLPEGGTHMLENRDGSAIAPIDVNVHFDGRDFIKVSGDLWDDDGLINPADRFPFSRTIRWPDAQLPTHTSKAHSSIVSQDADGNRFRLIFYWQKVADLFD